MLPAAVIPPSFPLSVGADDPERQDDMRTLFLALALAIPVSLIYTMSPFRGDASAVERRVAPGPDCRQPATDTDVEVAPEPEAEPARVIYRRGMLRQA